MKERLLQWLACPDCHADLRLEAEERKGDEVFTGAFVCTGCSTRYPIVRGIPRFVSSDHYVGNFSLEWTLHRKTQVDSTTGRSDSEKTFQEKTGFSKNDIEGKLVLDAGVGSGRFMEIALRYGGEVIGVDLSFAVDAAYTNFGSNPKAHIVQGDILRLPFKREVFDVIYSIGVLHHTPDTKKAFLSLVPLLKQRGSIAIWVYDLYSHLPIIMSRYYRVLTTRMPKRLLYYLCYIAVPYYYLLQIPFLRHIFRAILPTAPWKDWRWRVLDTFDWYSPKYQWWHTDHEVYTWFADAGLKDIRVLDLPVAFSGKKGLAMPYSLEEDGFRNTDNGDSVRVLRPQKDEGSSAWKKKQAASIPEYEITHTSEQDPERTLMMESWNMFLLSSISELLPNHAHVQTIDIGCGTFLQTPPYAHGLSRLGVYVGLDPIRDSRERSYPFINARVEDLPEFFDNPTFDVFAFSSVLDHIENLDPVITVVRKMAKPGAIACFFVGVHDPSVLAEHYGRFLGKRTYSSLKFLHFAKQFFFNVGSMFAYYFSLLSRTKALQNGRPLDGLHFRYYTEASIKSEAQRFGNIKRFYRFPGTNWCFVSCVLSV